LARVARPADHHLDAVDLAHRMRERRRIVEPETLQRARPLDGHERVLVRCVAHLGPARLPLLEPSVRSLSVAGIDDEKVVTMAHPVHDQVVHDPPALVREQRVLGLSVGEPVEIVRQHRLEELGRHRAFDVQLSHVRDIERAGVRPDGEMLGDDARVLHGHLPPRERHHARPRCDVAFVEGRSAQGDAHGRDNSRSTARPFDSRVARRTRTTPALNRHERHLPRGWSPGQSRRKLGTSMSVSSSRGRGSKLGTDDSDELAADVTDAGSTRLRRGRPPPKPVAITVTRTSSPSVSSMTAPKMTFAFGSAWPVTTSAASFTSKRTMSDGPVMFSSTPVAPASVVSSSGDETAAVAAAVARPSPRAIPIPISADPASRMIVRTSAKSRLTRPGTVMRSVMPCTPWRRMSSAMRN